MFPKTKFKVLNVVIVIFIVFCKKFENVNQSRKDNNINYDGHTYKLISKLLKAIFCKQTGNLNSSL